MLIRNHRGFGHGLKPGTTRDLNCPSCTAEAAAGIMPDITAGAPRDAAGPPEAGPSGYSVVVVLTYPDAEAAMAARVAGIRVEAGIRPTGDPTEVAYLVTVDGPTADASTPDAVLYWGPAEVDLDDERDT
jgi:hypothetical protein